MPKSRIDNNVIVDEDHWAITLIRARSSNHAELVIEGSGDLISHASDLWPEYWRQFQFQGNYWMMIVHLTGSGNRRFPDFLSECRCYSPEILIHNATKKRVKYDEKYRTFIKSPYLIKRLLFDIEQNIESSCNLQIMPASDSEKINNWLKDNKNTFNILLTHGEVERLTLFTPTLIVPIADSIPTLIVDSIMGYKRYSHWYIYGKSGKRDFITGQRIKYLNIEAWEEEWDWGFWVWRSKESILLHRLSSQPISEVESKRSEILEDTRYYMGRQQYDCDAHKTICRKPLKFNLVGDKSIFSSPASIWEKIYWLNRVATPAALFSRIKGTSIPNFPRSACHNCISYLRRKLKEIDIKLPKSDTDIFFTSTSQYTDNSKCIIS